MSRLFIEIYFDEDVDVVIATLLRARGFNVTTTQEAGQIGNNDEEQLSYAVSREMAFLTHNRTDFESLVGKYFAEGKDRNGVIMAVRRQPYEIAQRLLVILNYVTADEMVNQVRYI